MSKRSYSGQFILGVALALGSMSVSAQVAELRGQVFLQAANGQKAPLPDAQIDIFRLDLAAKYSAKADRSGTFVMAGLPFAGRYIIAASHPSGAPAWVEFRFANAGPVELVLKPGDGKRLTLDDIKGSSTSGPAAGNDPANAANQKIVETNAILQRTFKAGNDAVSAAAQASQSGDHDLAIHRFTDAIAQYDEGLAADPEQPTIIANKAVALKGRGVERYNLAVRMENNVDAKDTALNAAKSDFKLAAEASTRAVGLIKNLPTPTDPTELQRFNASKYAALATWAQAMKLYVGKVDQTQTAAGAEAYSEYMAVEPDPVKKANAHLEMAQMLFDAGDAARSLVEYQRILATQPASPEANLGAGLSLYAQGDKSKYQQAANYLQRFVDLAPDSNPLKADAKAILIDLKNTEKITPKP